MIVNIPHEFRYVLDRGLFEYRRNISNMVFLINQHLDDEDDSFLESDLFKNQNEKILEKSAIRWCYEIGVLGNLLDEIPSKYNYTNGYTAVIIEGEEKC